MNAGHLKVNIYTLGCKVNQCESQNLRGLLENAGFDARCFEKICPADIHVVNSCAVTAESENKCKRLLRRLKSMIPEPVVAVCGCAAQCKADGLNADIILGSKNKYTLPDTLRSFLENRRNVSDVPEFKKNEGFSFAPAPTDRLLQKTRGFLKIEDGCNRFCTYCIVPYTRGPVRSMPIEVMKTELHRLADSGFKEIVLTGINLSAYGSDIKLSLCDAVKAAEACEFKRIRLGSLEADLITDEFLETVTRVKGFCPQFHLSLQSGSDSVLKRMGRKYDSGGFYELIKKIRKKFENPSVTTDVMVGFPEETEKEFDQSLMFIKNAGFSRLHVFSYSRRPGTPASSMPQVSSAEKKRRAEIMLKEGERLSEEFAVKQIGLTGEVLFETAKNGIYRGWTKNYTLAEMRCERDIRDEIINIKITGSKGSGCLCEEYKL